MPGYLREIKTISDQLASIGNPLTERMKIFSALHGLGREYESIKTSIKGSMDLYSNFSFDDIALTSYHARLQSYTSS